MVNGLLTPPKQFSKVYWSSGPKSSLGLSPPSHHFQKFFQVGEFHSRDPLT